MAINFIKDEILRLEQFDTLCNDERNAEKWQSLLFLMQREWFFRRWVVQEIALAQDAVVYCGSDEINWKDFSVAVELFVEVETATHRLSEVMQKDPRFYHVPGWFEYVSALGASLLVEATGMVFRYYKPEKTIGGTAAKPTRGADGTVLSSGSEGDGTETAIIDPISQRRPLLSLEYLVSKLSIFQASEPRDSIYALLAIANDGYPVPQGPEDQESLRLVHEVLSETAEQKPFPVNYAHPYPDVCQDFIKFCIDRSDKTRALGEYMNSFTACLLPLISTPTASLMFRRLYANNKYSEDILCRPFAPEAETNASKYSHPKPKSEAIKEYGRKLDALHEAAGLPHSELWDKMLKYFPPRKGADEEVKLPSWIPRLSSAPFEMYHQAGVPIQKLGRKNADPLVAPPGHSRNYDAAQSRVFEKTLRFKKRRGQVSPTKLFLSCQIISVRELLSSHMVMLPGSWAGTSIKGHTFDTSDTLDKF